MQAMAAAQQANREGGWNGFVWGVCGVGGFVFYLFSGYTRMCDGRFVERRESE
jgi:hypothetical protein